MNYHDEPRDLSTWRCPECGWQTTSSINRTCNNCGYRGDWIQPGETELYVDLFEEMRHLDNPAYCAPTTEQ
jgi:hypothetical protein